MVSDKPFAIPVAGAETFTIKSSELLLLTGIALKLAVSAVLLIS
jgi:hypothetical protein